VEARPNDRDDLAVFAQAQVRGAGDQVWVERHKCKGVVEDRATLDPCFTVSGRIDIVFELQRL
jgi:hypothetical protein